MFKSVRTSILTLVSSTT